ncbi:glycine cleavage system transcriptional repressor [Gammaproteobacteria bacterium]
MKTGKMNHLVIAALGQDRPGLVNDLSSAILEAGCNVADSRMTVLSNEFSLLMLISGPWNAVAKFENQIGALQNRLGLTITSRRTEQRQPTGDMLPYQVEVISLDHPGIVYQLANFFSNRAINIEEMITNSYAAAHTGSPMFSVNMTVAVPADTHIARLREEFLDFCDEMNLDAVIEPVRS